MKPIFLGNSLSHMLLAEYSLSLKPEYMLRLGPDTQLGNDIMRDLRLMKIRIAASTQNITRVINDG